MVGSRIHGLMQVKVRGWHTAQPKDLHCRLAKRLGLKAAISTDVHAEVELDFMRFGVDQARRGWLEAADVLNTRPVDELRTLLRRRRQRRGWPRWSAAYEARTPAANRFAQAWMKDSRSALTLSLSVVHMPCGAPS